MSEQAGPISIERWQQFETALNKYAQQKDWDRVVLVNDRMIQTLKQAGKPTTRSQLIARQALAKTHANILQQLQQAKMQLAREIDQFKQQQEGLAAYQLTSLSGEQHDD
ncbi:MULTISPECIES: hypothetical protein [Shewanella]|uniref:hypothetical protein n=1 Tax=Shewanella TaxID=22 RepID=UPI000491C5D7|nr:MULTISPECIES: hypothetical protein [Shewanella]QLE87571.1 hypothetical protein FLM48_22330 [Shewanella sp. Scap07]